ncbi:hypothetical protein DsansV1_C19g0159281 [Dioscorea sansibarensis]
MLSGGIQDGRDCTAMGKRAELLCKGIMAEISSCVAVEDKPGRSFIHASTQ